MYNWLEVFIFYKAVLLLDSMRKISKAYSKLMLKAQIARESLRRGQKVKGDKIIFHRFQNKFL